MPDTKTGCIFCGAPLDNEFCCHCNKCGEIELVDKLPKGPGAVENEKFMTD